MDREALLAALPDNAQFNGAFPYVRKGIVEQFIASILDAMEEDEREPDAWEADHIARALGFLLARWYNAALATAENALIAPEDRAPEQPNLAGDVPSIRHLREALDHVRGVPARAH